VKAKVFWRETETNRTFLLSERTFGANSVFVSEQKMEFPKNSKIKLTRSPDEESFESLLPHNCLFYILPPLIDVSLQDFEELAIERLKLLRIVEQAGVKFPKILSAEWKQHIIEELNLAGLRYFVRLLSGNGNKEQDMIARRRDYLSHFILRFAYCRSEDLRR
jgi:DNA primase large subunit